MNPTWQAQAVIFYAVGLRLGKVSRTIQLG